MSTTNSYESKAAVAGLTLARVIMGVILVTHGFQKLTGFDEWLGHVQSMGLPMPHVSAWFAVAGELLGGAGLIVGLLTPIAALGVLCTMIVAIATVHWSHGLLAAKGGFEYPLLLAANAFFFMLRGAGPVSVDAWLAHNHIVHVARAHHDRASMHVPVHRG